MRQAHIFNIWIQTNFAGGQWSKSYQHLGLHGNKNAILEVDVEYPKELQKKHNKLPFL